MKNHKRLRQLGIAILSLAVLASGTPVIAAETTTVTDAGMESALTDEGAENSYLPESDDTASDDTGYTDEAASNDDGQTSIEEEIIYDDITDDSAEDGIGENEEPTEEVLTDAEENSIQTGSCGDSLTWTFEDGALTISGTGAMYDYPEGAPWQGLEVTSVTLEEGLTGIGMYAFADCTGLTSLRLPESITSISSYAFAGCTGIDYVEVWPGVSEIGAYAFSGCTALQCLYIDDGVMSIGEGAFSNCTILNIISLSGTLESIGDYAFANCTNMQDITIRESISYIGTGAFANCTTLRDVYIDSTSISMDNAFQPVDGQTITLHGYDNVKEFVEATGNANIVYEPYPSYCGEHITWTLEDGVLTLDGWGQMYDYYNGAPWYDQREEITSIYIVSSYNWTSDFTYIGAYSFVGCTNLTSITFPQHCSFTIGYGAFWGCTGLTSLTLPDTLTGIDSYAFAACTGLNYVYIPDSTTSIGYGAFYGCNDLTSARISESVTSIEPFTFADCTAMESITIPESVTSINEDAFSGCTALKDVYIRSNDISMDNVFKPVSGQTITLYGNENVKAYVEALGNENVLYQPLPGSCGDFLTWTFEDGTLTISGYGAMFDYYENDYNLAPWRDYDITSLIFTEGITSIGTYAFTGCTGITSITFPESLTTINCGAFKNCTGLTNVTFANGLDIIGEDAFYHCTSLNDFTIPESVTWIGWASFYECYSLTSITIPETVTTVCPWAFAHCTSLVDVVLSDTITEMPDDLFNSCTALTSITIPEGVTELGRDEFAFCTALTEVTLPSTLEYVNGAFAYCTGLKILVIPENVIVPQRLIGCTGLTDVYYYTETTYLYNIIIPEGDQVVTLHGKQNIKDYVESAGNENLLYAELIEINAQPASVSVNENQNFQFSVTAEGLSLSYLWQYSTDNGTTWVDTNCTSASYTGRVRANQNGYLYRCVITDRYGYSVTTDTATLTVSRKDDHDRGHGGDFGPHSFNEWGWGYQPYWWFPAM